MFGVLAACLSMTLQDLFGTFLVVAEARNRAVLAGAMDAFGDLARNLVVVYGAGVVIKQGWDAYTVFLMVAISGTSFVGTTVYTRLSNHFMPAGDSEIAELREQIEQQAVAINLLARKIEALSC